MTKIQEQIANQMTKQSLCSNCKHYASCDRSPINNAWRYQHALFCQHIQNIDLDTAKQLLANLHLTYLREQAMVIEIARAEFTKFNKL